MQCPGLIAQTEHQAGAIGPGARTALTAQHQKAGGIGRVVLNVPLEDGHLVALTGQFTGDGRRVFFLRGQFGRAGIGTGLNHFGLRQTALDPSTALGQRLRVDVEFANVFATPLGGQTVGNLENDL